MDSKKILLVSNGFYPELSPRSFRATELAREFVRQGHEVTVYTKFRNNDYSAFLNEYPMKFRMWSKPKFPRVPDFKFKPFSFFSKALSRVLSVLFEYPAIEEKFRVKKILRKETGYDLMISFAVPFTVHWGVANARTKSNRIAKRWIADCGDPYMFARLDTYRKPFYFKYSELNFCRKCDYITVPFKEMSTQFYPEFLDKIKVIPQGFNFNDIKIAENFAKNTHPVFVFAGSVIPGKRDLKQFLEYLIASDLEFVFIVFTSQPDYFKKYKQILGNKLEVREYIDRLDLIFEMSKADFLVNVDTKYDSESNVEAIPSKIIDYALSGRPIMNLNSDSLDSEMVDEFLNGDYSKRRKVDISGYNIQNVSEKFLELL